MKEIVGRLHENRQIELAKSILESNGYKVSKKSKRLKESTGEPSALKKMVDINADINSYTDYPEIFEIYTEEAMDAMTKYLGCRKEDLVELIGRDESGEEPEYQELCDYVYANSHRVSEIHNCTNYEYGPTDSLSPSVMDDGSGVKYVFHMDGNSFPGFIVSKNIR